MKGYDVDGDSLKSAIDFPAIQTPTTRTSFVEMDCMAAACYPAKTNWTITKIYADPVRNPNGTTGVNIHLDAGDLPANAKYQPPAAAAKSVTRELDSGSRPSASRQPVVNPAREAPSTTIIWVTTTTIAPPRDPSSVVATSMVTRRPALLGPGKRRHPRGGVCAQAQATTSP